MSGDGTIIRNIVDPETGEVTGYIREGQYIGTHKQKDSDEETILFLPDESFLKVWIKALPFLGRELSNSALAATVLLAQHVSYGSGVLSFQNGELLRPSNTSNLLRRSLRTRN